MKLKRGFKRHEGGQVPTQPVTVCEIMSSPEFALGVVDVRAGRLYRAAYDGWDTNQQWFYERSQWGVSTSRRVVLKRNNKVTPEALRAYHNDII